MKIKDTSQFIKSKPFQEGLEIIPLELDDGRMAIATLNHLRKSKSGRIVKMRSFTLPDKIYIVDENLVQTGEIIYVPDPPEIRSLLDRSFQDPNYGIFYLVQKWNCCNLGLYNGEFEGLTPRIFTQYRIIFDCTAELPDFIKLEEYYNYKPMFR